MATLGETRNNVLDELYRSGEMTAQAHLAINAAVNYFKRRHFWFNEARATSQTVNGQERYALPSDFGDIIGLVINVSQNDYPLLRRTYEEMQILYVSAANYTGYPQDYSIERNELRLGPIPNDAYTMTMFYRQEPATTSADTQTNIFLTHAEYLIRKRAAADLAFSILQEPQRALGFKAQEREEFTSLVSDSTRRLMRGSGNRRR